MVKVVVEYQLMVQMVLVLMEDPQNHWVMVEEYHLHLLVAVIVIHA
jgi:hypothetical protein